MTTPLPLPYTITFSSDFYLASGTVTVDLPRRKVLIIHELASNTYYLPRGRKDWSEPLEATAIRETYEESGCSASLLPVPLSTRCTPPSHNPPPPTSNVTRTQLELKNARFDPSGDLLLPNTARLTEPIALMQHLQKKNNALAVVLWYVATGDSQVPLAKETQMADEEYGALWVSFEEAPKMMVNSAYAQVLQRGIDLALAASEMDLDSEVHVNNGVAACQEDLPQPPPSHPQPRPQPSSPKVFDHGMGTKASETEVIQQPSLPVSPPDSEPS
ncbi:hypothetical protein B0T21DRAFT_352089 [Apiosordaria backusii]|uniref:Nudix hydrolase domain-containing protein n=1 Tax=Apiosordaria backusii TaxID=314023 RepID=A0AA40DYY2_9PEZI|nr:hypothetical protein B0T21DRAFT_352089 [Apiosordaria backusii]